MKTSSVADAVEAIAQGQFVLVIDDENRENEGDLIIAAEKVTAEAIAFMVNHTSGVICVPLVPERLDELRLPLMVLENTDSHKTAFTVSIDYRRGTTTGISASDRASSVLALVDPATRPEDLSRPGHIFPLRYQEGGVLVRPGHTEAAVDLARLAGLYPAGVLCEVVNEDGTMARGDDLIRFSERFDVPIITIADLVEYRWSSEALVQRVVETTLPTEFGDFGAFGYLARHDGSEHVALVRGDVAGKRDVLVRVHSQCLTGDVFGSLRCDCGSQLREALRAISERGEGVVVYDRGHEGRGIGLLGKLAAYRLQDKGLDTVEANLSLGFPADGRNYGVDAQILHDLKVSSAVVLTNNPDKVRQLERFGIEVSGRVPIHVGLTSQNREYLRAKAGKLGHILDTVDEDT